MLTAFVIATVYVLQWYVSYKILIDAMRFQQDVDRGELASILWLSSIPIMIVVAPIIWLVERPATNRSREIIYKKKVR
jgi:hypothetical protein